MESATKAILITLLVLIIIVICTAFMLLISSLTNSPDNKYPKEVNEQMLELNDICLSYERENVRGSELATLFHKVIEYNEKNAIQGWSDIEIGITISSDFQDSLAYNGENRLITTGRYTQNTIEHVIGPVSSEDDEYSKWEIGKLEDKYQKQYIRQLTTKIEDFQSFWTNGYLIDDEDKNIAFDKTGWLPKPAQEYGGIDQIYQDTLLYYEYVRFQRSLFDCVETVKNPNTDTIIKMEFKCTGIGV